MKYRKGEYILVPNKEQMRGLPMPTQLVWVWLCSYADGYGQCWPSRERIRKDIGAKSKRTVDAHLARLEKMGWIEKTPRYKDHKKQSNLYQLNLVEGGASIAPVHLTTFSGASIAHRTKPIELNKEKELTNKEIAEKRKQIALQLNRKK